MSILPIGNPLLSPSFQVRLAVSTFLVEGLGISWREGMNHFAEFLVDYDEAINTNMWMNSGCVGLDPYYVGMSYKRMPKLTTECVPGGCHAISVP